MNDLRRWREDPRGMVEWLLGGEWVSIGYGGHVLQVDGGQIAVVGTESAIVGWAWCPAGDVLVATLDTCTIGDETGDAGIRAASLAILASKPVWRTPDGYDVILGRYPTDDELSSARSWLVCLGPCATGLNDLALRWRREEGHAPPLYCVPLRHDGLPGRIGNNG